MSAVGDPAADLGEPIAPHTPPADGDAGWKRDAQGRQYTSGGPGSGIRGSIYRQGEETVEQARERRARDAERPRDKRPRKTKRPPMPDAPKKPDLKELERMLAEALKAPAMICATFGDEWSADHFVVSGPYLARNLIVASEHNPWLRRKLEEAAVGQDAMMLVVSLVGVGGALFAYAIPPIIYWFDLPVPDRARAMFGIPAKRRPTYAATAKRTPPVPEQAFEPEPEPGPEPAVPFPAAEQAA
ncbi:MAG TPA: hypothetical protein VKG23_01270 [Thermoanaerobaculia bacterium]|nr:hypothetical protein [Thermoanaerobaculia bacterium]